MSSTCAGESSPTRLTRERLMPCVSPSIRDCSLPALFRTCFLSINHTLAMLRFASIVACIRIQPFIMMRTGPQWSSLDSPNTSLGGLPRRSNAHPQGLALLKVSLGARRRDRVRQPAQPLVRDNPACRVSEGGAAPAACGHEAAPHQAVVPIAHPPHRRCDGPAAARRSAADGGVAGDCAPAALRAGHLQLPAASGAM